LVSQIPALGRDIRKIPRIRSQRPKRINGKRSSNESIGMEGTKSTSVASYDQSGSGFSAPAIVSSATSARDIQDSESSTPSPKQKKVSPRKEYGAGPNDRGRSPLHHRYWNEFDDGDEVPENEPYVIYVDPDAPSTFPGAETLSKMWTNVRGLIRPSKHQDDTLRPLLKRRDSTGQTSADSSDSEDVEAALGKRLREQDRRRSATLAQHRIQIRRSPEREKALFRSYIGAFTASFFLLFITAFLPFTGRKKEAVQTEIGVLVGVAAALCFGIVGLSCLLVRRDNVGWWHRSAVLLAFSIVCVLSGSLLSLVGHRA
jgi:hypothetical protein